MCLWRWLLKNKKGDFLNWANPFSTRPNRVRLTPWLGMLHREIVEASHLSELANSA
jgi:hypothetical protein